MELNKIGPNITIWNFLMYMLFPQGHDLVIGNVGDSRAVLGTRDENDCLIAVQLTVDLKPNLPSMYLLPIYFEYLIVPVCNYHCRGKLYLMLGSKSLQKSTFCYF